MTMKSIDRPAAGLRDANAHIDREVGVENSFSSVEIRDTVFATSGD